GGFMHDGRSYCFSTESLYLGYPQTQTNPVTGVQTLTYIFQEVPSDKGAFGLSATAVKSRFWAVSRSGINEYGAGESSQITNDDIYPLFPHDGQAGTPTNGYNPIDFTQPNFIRLYATDDGLYFLFHDTIGSKQCFRYDLNVKGWWPFLYQNTSPQVIYQEEGQNITSVLMGGLDGKIYTLGSATTDDGLFFSFSFTTPYLDFGDPRAQKLFLDYMIDVDPQGVGLTLTPKLDNGNTILASGSILGGTSR